MEEFIWSSPCSSSLNQPIHDIITEVSIWFPSDEFLSDSECSYENPDIDTPSEEENTLFRRTIFRSEINDHVLILDTRRSVEGMRKETPNHPYQDNATTNNPGVSRAWRALLEWVEAATTWVTPWKELNSVMTLAPRYVATRASGDLSIQRGKKHSSSMETNHKYTQGPRISFHIPIIDRT